MPVTIRYRTETTLKSPEPDTPPVAQAARSKRKPSTPWGSIIRQIREDLGLSQRELATVAGVNRNALRRLEKEEVAGTVDVLERLAEALGYELDLFGSHKRLVPM